MTGQTSSLTGGFSKGAGGNLRIIGVPVIGLDGHAHDVTGISTQHTVVTPVSQPVYVVRRRRGKLK